jgi:glycosyltransferase involved in cell wall biosynthesis
MGYAVNLICRELVKQGHDVHYVTGGLPPYYRMNEVEATYGTFQRQLSESQSSEQIDGYRLHHLPVKRMPGGVRLVGLAGKLNEIKPDIVQTFAHLSWVTVDSARNKKRGGYRLFSGNHTTKSIYPMARDGISRLSPHGIRETFLRFIPGRILSHFVDRCYGATKDCTDVAVNFFGVPSAKIDTIPLGVDTDIFHPARDGAARAAFRKANGIADEDVLCVYTGRFSEDKNPLLLAQAVADLRARGERYRSLFVGEGVQREAIAACDGALVLPFVEFTALAAYYRAADIGVWPTQESTSMLDAAACGIPIVVNDTIVATERMQGNGLMYRLNDRGDLAAKLLQLKDPAMRAALGAEGARKMSEEFAWPALVRRRVADYRAFSGIAA